MSQSRRSTRGGAGTRALITSAVVFALSPLSAAVQAQSEESSRRQIEEVLVTAEKRQASTQDTSISITAFEGEFLADFGIRNQEDLANFIPATTIQPYDMAVRGIGRSFRALGGDPGIATYFDGVYSEDFGIASTEGGLYDIERIEVLRGPQGTLYGRNAVGGAINFISNGPTDEFEGEVKANIGTRGLFETYALLSGPIIDGLLNARATGIKRERDGYYDDNGFGPGGSSNDDVGNYGDENYTLTLDFTPFDNFSWRVRGNERSYRRRMGGAGQTAGIIALSEFGDQTRDTTSEIFGFRRVLSTNDDPLAASFDISQGASALAATMNANLNLTDPTGRNFLNTAENSLLTENGLLDLFRFTNPGTGETVIAQRLRPGLDVAADDEPSRNFGCTGGTCVLAPVVDADDFSGGDLETATNGQQDEFFDHQAAYSTMEWDLNDRLTLKYVFGYTDYFYDRTSDRDLTSNPNIGETFYVSQENENFQHELQFLFDFGERATLTSGIYFYEARITQRGDFYSEANESRYTQPVDYGASQGIPGLNAAVLSGIFPGEATLFSARGVYNGLDADAQADLVNSEAITTSVGLWLGDNADRPGGCTSIPSGPATCGSFVEYQTENQTEAFAFYNQAELFLTDQISLTLGVRYAEDQRTGEENVFIYSESVPTLNGFSAGNTGLGDVLLLGAIPTGQTDPTTGLALSALGAPLMTTGSLLQFNVATGAIDPATLTQTGDAITRYRGVPFGISFYRPVDETYDAWTWRANIDWEPNETTLIYAGVTTGYRAGGFNLANLSNRPVYDQEEITAYEIGWKDQLFDRSLQVNASVYYYDYEDVHQSFSGFSNNLGATVNNVEAVPSAEIFGFEADVFWLATDRLTLGGNFSFTDSEYTSEVLGLVDTDFDGVGDTESSIVIDAFNTAVPDSLFGDSPVGRTVNISGNQMLLIPEIKWTLFGMYNVPLGNRGSLEFRSNVSYTDEVFFSIENNPVDKAPEYYRWDARVSWTSADESIIVSGFVNNILDEIGVRQIARYGENQNYLRSATPTDPRLMGLEFTYRFGAYQ